MSTFQLLWVILSIVLGLFFLGLGVWIRGRPLGVLIDSRNKMSLSRLQIVAWTWILLSAFLAVAWDSGTVNIEMATEIWALMGISVGSAAGSVLVKGTKSHQTPSNEEQKGESHRMGILKTNERPEEAKLTDLFSGEELTDNPYVDVAKVQMFFFTVALVAGYAGVLWSFTWEAEKGVINFPAFSTTMVTLLGISHAGYLTVKAAPKTPTTP